MSRPPTKTSGRGAHAARWLGRAAQSLTLRVYALALMALIGYSSWRAFGYLVDSLLAVAPPPAQVTEWPRRLDSTTLEQDRDAWRGLATVEHARTPLAHFHRLDTWIQPDRANNCTTSGCHPALPHAKHKESRAFLNMHATSMHCGVCHMESESRPLRVVWYDPKTGAAREEPAALTAQTLLAEMTSDGPAARDALDDQRRLIELLRRAGSEIQGGQALASLAEHLSDETPGTEAYRGILQTGIEILPRISRGEYGAKLALAEPGSGAPVLAHAGSASDVEAYLREGAQRSDAERTTLLDRIHSQRRSPLPDCGECHVPDGRLDFRSAGYSSARAQQLTSSAVVRMIQHMREGQAFYLPKFIQPPAQQSAPSAPDGKRDEPEPPEP